MITILFWLGMLVVSCLMWLFGLLPEQRAQRQARRLAYAQARLARLQQRAAERQREQWHELVERQKAQGNAGFADQDEAADALSGRGGRRSNLDERSFP